MEGITANDLIISTHILARRMTATPTLPRTQFYFNSHPRKEDDRYVFSILDQLQYFNSHPRKEDDDCKHRSVQIFRHFNSHPRKEDD